MTNAERILQEKERLAVYLQAEIQILRGQSYAIGNRSLTRANLAEVRKAIETLTKEIQILTTGGGGIKVQRGVYRDL